MYAVGNFEKFINDHPELHDQRQTILDKVQEFAQGSRAVSGFVPDEVFSSALAKEFHREVTNNADHIRIGIKEIQSEPASSL